MCGLRDCDDSQEWASRREGGNVKQEKLPKAHTVVKRVKKSTLLYGANEVEYFCTTCGRTLEQDEVNKRCKG